MKNKLQVYRSQIEKFYFEHNTICTAVLRVVLALFIFFYINTALGANPTFRKAYVPIVLSALAAFIPFPVTMALGFLLIGVHLLSMSPILLGLYIVLVALMYLLVFRMCYDKWIVVFATILLFWIKLPYLAPLILGMVFGPSVIVPAGLATVLTFFLKICSGSLVTAKTESAPDMLGHIGTTIMKFSRDGAMMTWVLVTVGTILVITIIKTFRIRYCKEIALGAGALTELVLYLIGNQVFHADLSVAAAVLLIILSAGICLIVLWTLLPLDYTKTEYVEFFDDEYYYFVRAVPLTPTMRASNEMNKEGKSRPQPAASDATVKVAAEVSEHGKRAEKKEE